MGIRSMSSIALLIWASSIGAGAANADEPDASAVIEATKRVAKAFQDLSDSKVWLYSKCSGELEGWSVYRYTIASIDYDVKRTDSLIHPFVAELHLTVTHDSNEGGPRAEIPLVIPGIDGAHGNFCYKTRERALHHTEPQDIESAPYVWKLYAGYRVEGDELTLYEYDKRFSNSILDKLMVPFEPNLGFAARILRQPVQ